MKVEVKAENELNILPYPKLMKWNGDNNLIVLFTEPKCGICLSLDIKKKNTLGSYIDNWAETEFTDFKGSITITQ